MDLDDLLDQFQPSQKSKPQAKPAVKAKIDDDDWGEEPKKAPVKSVV